jgi:hypothetical protein
VEKSRTVAVTDPATVDDPVREHGPKWANPKVLKGGSWLEPNPANKRAAVRRYEVCPIEHWKITDPLRQVGGCMA